MKNFKLVNCSVTYTFDVFGAFNFPGVEESNLHHVRFYKMTDGSFMVNVESDFGGALAIAYRMPKEVKKASRYAAKQLLETLLTNTKLIIMAKIELKGTIVNVFPVEEIGDKKTPKQSIVVFVPAYKDEWGDVKGKDEHWQLDILGKDNIEKMGFNKTFEGMKGTFRVWLNSKLVQSKTPGNPDMYIINASLANTEFKA